MAKFITFVVITLLIIAKTATGQMTSKCEDAVPDCGGYDESEICEGNRMAFGAVDCRKTCGHCTAEESCRNKATNCTENNICHDAKGLIQCQKFCGFCGVLGSMCNVTKTKQACAKIAGASCQSDSCTCNTGYRERAGIECEEVYWKKCNISDECDKLHNSVCTIPQSHATTLSPWTNTSHCICKVGYLYNHTGHSCDADCKRTFPTVSHGNATLVTDYTTVGATANVTCDPGFYHNVSQLICELMKDTGSWTNATCLPVHKRNCTEENECQNLDNAECIGLPKRCSCKKGFYYNETDNSCEKVLLESCGVIGNRSYCTRVEHARCRANDTCMCGSGFEMVSGTHCREVYNKTCYNREDLNCTDLNYSSCSTSQSPANGTCLCKIGYYYNKTDETHAECLQVHKRNCTGNHACQNLPSAECIGLQMDDSPKTCLCAKGFYFNNTSNSCDKVLQVPCNDIADDFYCRRVDHAICMANSTCMCGSGFVIVNGSHCLEVHKRNCTEDKECQNLDNAECIGLPKRCSCKKGFYYNETGNSCEKVLLESCGVIGNRSYCTRVEHARCRANDTCMCGSGFEMVSGTHCREVYNKTCYREDLNCTDLKYSSCSTSQSPANGTCLCKSGYYYNKTDETHAECLPVCPNLSNPNNGAVNTSQNYEAVYSCHKGYNISGSSVVRCQKNGTWDNNSTTCEIKDCCELKDLSNGSVNTSNGTTYQSVATFSCAVGYTLYGNNYTRCLSKGNWSDYDTNCTINDCLELIDPANGSVQTSNGTKYQAIATFSCNDGYTLYGNNYTQCLSKGNWSQYVTNCTINDCGHPNLTNGNVNATNGTKYQAVITYSCNHGFDIDGNATSICRADKTWTGNRSCKIKTCDSPKGIEHGKLTLDSGGPVFNHSVTYTCDSGYETKNNTVLTCNETGMWNSPPPNCTDIDECKTYNRRCHKWATCNNTVGNYTCHCGKGYTDKSGGMGYVCEDVNECKDNTACNPNSSQCINYPGGYECFCYDGWTGKTCETDINECKNNDACGYGANCTNFDGGYNCTCDPKLPKGNPKIHCYENVIIELETKVQPSRGDNELIDAKPIPNRIPYFGEEFTSYRPYMNGFLALDYQPIYENYGPGNATEWKRITRGYTVIAPLWTDLDSTGLIGGLSVHFLDYYASDDSNSSERKDLEMLGRKFNIPDFKPRVAIVATWVNVTSSSYIQPTRLISTQNATMQMILISDGVYSHIMFNYDQEQWSLKLNPNISSSSGFSLANKTGFITATQMNYSNLNNDSNVKPYQKGRWIYNVSSVSSDNVAILRNESQCLEFRHNTTINKWLKDMRAKSTACPCSEIQIQYDYGFHTVAPKYTNPQFPMICYEEWFYNNDGVKQTCCYRKGALKKESTGGGFAAFETDKYNTSDYFDKCCGGKTDRHLCHLYYEMNPSDDCSRYEPADEPIHRYRRSLIGYMNLPPGYHWVQ